ncbi:hypothetical protein EHQ07_05395 [Leptospira gomenensis]|nr:hypothetical protein EHQ07_05395 [Leptospira gomenensis]
MSQKLHDYNLEVFTFRFWWEGLSLFRSLPSFTRQTPVILIRGRVVTFPSPTSKIIKRQVLGRLHHVYFHSEVKNDIPA